MTNPNREMDYVAELLGQVLYDMIRKRALEETELSIEARLRQKITKDQLETKLTSNQRMDHAVNLLREVLDEKVREEGFESNTAHLIVERMHQKIRDYRDRRTKAHASMIT
ncbi:MAG: hypothetical protein WA941_18010 [Nitrososphaeraceae archaeon]